MSDYLGNLAARSLTSEAAAPAVQPRLASRFEPLSPAAPGLWSERAPAVEAVFREEVVEAVTAPPTPSRPMRSDRRRLGPDSENLPHPGPHIPDPPLPSSRPPFRERREAEKTLQLDSPLPATEEGRRSGEAPEVRARAEESRLDPPAQALTTPTPPLPFSHPPHRERRGLLSLSLQSPSSPGGGEGGWERRAGEVRALAAPAPVRVSRDQESAPERIEKALRAASIDDKKPAAVLQPSMIANSRPSPRPEPPAAEPVIHVTIGRIEVRATPAPKAPARERQAARPPVDLEEYLRQRAGGERR